MKILKKICLPTLTETEAEAQAIAPLLSPGDTLLLEGNLGVGKTAFARALVRTLSADDALVVPSPTFNLVQVYDTPKGCVWHVDLYRLSPKDDLFELGLAEAFADSICLIEWPDRLGSFLPPDSLLLQFILEPETNLRDLTIRGGKKWEKGFPNKKEKR